MALIEEAFERYKLKVEKNATTDGTATDRGRFITIFNESQNKWIESKLQNRGIDDVRYIQKFLILDKKISDSSKTFDRFNFRLPKNYLDLADVRAKASKDKCSDYLELFEARTENLNTLLHNEHSKPSFKWRESFYTINQNTISIYVDDDFTIDYVLLDYYRYPNQISLIDPFNPESQFNESIEIEWDDKNLDRILSICAGESQINEENPNFQLQFLRNQQ
jgi:hypothetical protein